MRRSAGVDVEAMLAGAPDPVADSIVDQAPVAVTIDTGPAGCWTLRVRRDGRVLRAAGAARRSVELRVLSSAMATALVGGINELVLATVEEGGADRLDQLEATIVELVEPVLRPAGPVPA